jgi:hypothetical protein
MSKMKASVELISRAPILPISLPPSAHSSDPISWGSNPEIYTADGLKKVAIEKHARTDEFEKRLMGIWWTLQCQPVPYIFRTSDGVLRSLDAGCLGFLSNRWKPEIELIEHDGYVHHVVPCGALAQRYEAIRSKLVSAVAPRS